MRNGKESKVPVKGIMTYIRIEVGLMRGQENGLEEASYLLRNKNAKAKGV